jgi:hypothetical protein
MLQVNRQLTSEEMQKKMRRRERNKDAAARCRQRRLDQMQILQKQVDELRQSNDHKSKMIDELKQTKEQYEHLLAKHGCKIQLPEYQQFVLPSTTSQVCNRVKNNFFYKILNIKKCENILMFHKIMLTRNHVTISFDLVVYVNIFPAIPTFGCAHYGRPCGRDDTSQYTAATPAA